MTAALNCLLTNQERDAAARVKENKDLKDKIEQSKKTMSDPLTHANNNVNKLIEETRLEFRADLDKVNKRLDKSDEENAALIRKAIEDNNATKTTTSENRDHEKKTPVVSLNNTEKITINYAWKITIRNRKSTRTK